MITQFLLLAVAWIAIGFASSHTDVRAFVFEPRAQGAATSVSAQRELLDRYCVTCHNRQLQTAGLALDGADVAKVAVDAEIWEKVVRKLRAGEMPPPGRPRPDTLAADRLASYLEAALDRAADARPNSGELPALQRLTRTEYRNAIGDLLGLTDLPREMDIALLLPADNTASGFDNRRDLLFVSSTQLEQYLTAARKISRLAVGDPAFPLFVDTYRIPSGLPQNVHIGGMPFGTRGGAVIRTHLPTDGAYAIQVDLAASSREPKDLEVTVDGELLTLSPAGDGGRVPSDTSNKPVLDPDSSSGTKRFDYQRRQAERAAENKAFKALVPLKAGPRQIIATFVSRTSALEEQELRPSLVGRGSQPSIESVTIAGPYNVTGAGDTPSRRRIFVCHPNAGAEERACARRILSALARRAYRRPVADADLRELLLSYESGRRERGFEAGIQQALERLLVSPHFLFRIERDPANVAPGTPYRITDLELASRLSFFLWSSIPDDELLEAAAKGELKDPAVLDRQVRRMLADPRSLTLVNNFVEQWLFLRDLKSKIPSRWTFRDFDESLRQALERETELFVDSVLRREDRSVLDLLTADYTFVNGRLARHYGIPNIYGSDFRRVTLDANSPRRGLLGQGSVLIVTAYVNRTSPVLRGKYILDNLLASPPPPPPPNIPALREETTEGKPLSMREAMARHRANPVCGSCHGRMDPLGLALENFDSVGRWRDRSESGTPVDASASLPDGTRFEGVAGLRQWLVSRPERFVIALTEKLFGYAIGRKVAYYDAPAIRKVVHEAAGSNYRFSALIAGIVTSRPFQTRMSQRP